MNDLIYPIDIDCVWIAIDKIGHLGAFVTAGEGAVPHAVLQTSDILLEEIETSLLQLTPYTESQLMVVLPRPDDFTALSERGFFVYDWTDVHKSKKQCLSQYELVAKPRQPKHYKNLPLLMSQYVYKIQLKSLLFSDAKTVDINAELPCSMASL